MRQSVSRGALSEAGSDGGGRTAPSIPSKYETILHKGASERDGFFCRSSRFDYNEVRCPLRGAALPCAPSTCPEGTQLSFALVDGCRRWPSICIELCHELGAEILVRSLCGTSSDHVFPSLVLNRMTCRDQAPTTTHPHLSALQIRSQKKATEQALCPRLNAAYIVSWMTPHIRCSRDQGVMMCEINLRLHRNLWQRGVLRRPASACLRNGLQ